MLEEVKRQCLCGNGGNIVFVKSLVISYVHVGSSGVPMAMSGNSAKRQSALLK